MISQGEGGWQQHHTTTLSCRGTSVSAEELPCVPLKGRLRDKACRGFSFSMRLANRLCYENFKAFVFGCFRIQLSHSHSKLRTAFWNA